MPAVFMPTQKDSLWWCTYACWICVASILL